MQTEEKICPQCGKRFVPSHGGAVYCSFDCRKEAARKRARLYAQRQRPAGVRPPRKKPAPPAVSGLDSVLNALLRYNEEHGTLLSYGQYMARFCRKETRHG